MFILYKLDDNKNVVSCTADEAEEFLGSEKKIVKQETVGGYFISTVFLGVDHNFQSLSKEPPILFETMLHHKGEWMDFQRRYCTYKDALDGHNMIVEKLNKGSSIYD